MYFDKFPFDVLFAIFSQGVMLTWTLTKLWAQARAEITNTHDIVKLEKLKG